MIVAAPGSLSTLSVALCTRNRPGMAASCVARLLECDPPADEILVVDQSDAPESRRLADALRGRGVRYLPTATRGLSRGRNIALAEARSELLAYTDDDCLVRRDWTRRLREAFARCPEAAAVTGASIPEAAEILDARTRAATTWNPPGPRTYRTVADPCEIGAGLNMAFRREALLAANGFDERLGAGRPLAGADEHDILHRLLSRGLPIHYDPSAVVSHLPWRDAEEQRRTDRCYAISRGGWAALALREGDAAPSRIVAASLAGSAARAARSLLSARFGAAYFHASLVGHTGIGFARGLAIRESRAPVLAGALAAGAGLAGDGA